MKKLLIFAFAILLIAAPVLAVENGTSLRNTTYTLYNAATGTTAATNTSVVTYDNTMKYASCDIKTGITATPGTFTFVLYGNNGTSSTLFDTGYPIVDTVTITTSATLTTLTTRATATTRPFRTIQGVLTCATVTTTTQPITVNCSAIQ